MLGPEALLIGAGLGVCAVRFARRDVPQPVGAVGRGSRVLRAISALLGLPIIAAFLPMEASGFVSGRVPVTDRSDGVGAQTGTRTEKRKTVHTG